MSKGREIVDQLDPEDLEDLLISVATEYNFTRDARHEDPTVIVDQYLRSYEEDERYYVLLGMMGVALKMISRLTAALLHKKGDKRMNKELKVWSGSFLTRLNDRRIMNRIAAKDFPEN